VVRSKPKHLRFHREFVRVADGGQFCLSWAHVSQAANDLTETAPLLFMCPGVLGDDQSWYLDHMAHVACLKGWRPVVYIRRGCLIEMTTARSQDFADAQKPDGDFATAMGRIQALYPSAPIMAVGFSMGGNYLANYLASRSDACPVVAACCVCAPVDNLAVSVYMQHVSTHVDYALRRYKNVSLEMNRAVITNDPEAQRLGVSVDKLVRAKSYREQCENDNFQFWKLPGETFNGYLERSSCYHRLGQIARPTLFLSAVDDCVCVDALLPTKEFEKNPHVVLATTQSGGHHSFIELFSSGPSFADKITLEWLEEALKLSMSDDVAPQACV